MLESVDVGLGCESGYDEVSYGVPLYGIAILERSVTKKLHYVILCRKYRGSFEIVNMVQVYYLRNMVHVACFHLKKNYLLV